jgi:hypothetical protein
LGRRGVSRRPRRFAGAAGAHLLADTVSNLLVLAARRALVLDLERRRARVVHSDHVLRLVVPVDRNVQHARLAGAEVLRIALKELLLGTDIVHHPGRGHVVRLRLGEREVRIRVAVARDELHLDRLGL